MDYLRLAEILFPEHLESPEYYETIYPKRHLPEGAMVTRLGPSPTGFIHLGTCTELSWTKGLPTSQAECSF